MPNGSWAGLEVKLGEGAADEAATSLLRMASKVDVERLGEPVALIVVTGGRFLLPSPRWCDRRADHCARAVDGFIPQPLAIVVIGGLLSSTVLTLIVLPTLYNLVKGAKERRREKRGEPAVADAAAWPSPPDAGVTRRALRGREED